jgi:hypothetical protein
MNRCSAWVRRSVGVCELVSMMAALGGRQLSAQGTAEPKNWTAAEDHQNMMAQLGFALARAETTRRPITPATTRRPPIHFRTCPQS